MAIEKIFNVPINLQRLELRNVTLQNLSVAPIAKPGLIYFDTALDTAGHFNNGGLFVPWDVSKATNLPNTVLANSSLTIGTTPISLGATVLSLAGLTAVNATTFTGALTGNATTATKLVTPRTLAIGGGATGTATAFDGSANITINVTALDATLLTGAISSARSWALTGDVTSVAGAAATTIAAGAVTLAKMASLPANTLIGNSTAAVGVPAAVTLSSELVFTAGVLGLSPGGIGNAALTNRNVTIGTTVIALGATSATLGGLTSVTSTLFTGALTGNASSANILLTARTIALSGGATGTATAFDGSANISIIVTAVDATKLTGLIPVASLPAMTGDVTAAAGSNATTIGLGAVTNAKLANSSLTVGTTAITLGTAATTLAGLVSVTSTTFVGALTGNAATATKLATARTIGITGGATGTATAFDGSANMSINVTAIDAALITGVMLASHISNLAATVQAYTLNSFAAPVADVSIGGFKLTNVMAGVADTDAVNVVQMRSAISNAAAGLTPKAAVRLATAAPISVLSGLLTIDSKVTVANDRVLVKDHTNPVLNGIYLVSAGAWALALDSQQGELFTGSMMLVTEGNANSGQQWWLVTSGAITVGTTALTFSLYNTNDGTIFDVGLAVSGKTITVKADTGIIVSVTGVAIDTTTVVRKVVATIGNGAAVTFNIAHNLNTQAITAVLINAATKAFEEAYMVATDNNTLSVSFANAPAANAYNVVIHG